MPEMSGFDLAKEIKTVENLKGIPTIILTSVGMKEEGKSCREMGINGYLIKPLRRDDLRKAIESVLGQSIGQGIGTLPELVAKHTIAEDNRKKVQILLAEDYPTNQQVAMRHLLSAGCQVDLAENGQQAVETYKRKRYDLILMDIQMPIMDGYEATKAIRDLERKLNKTEDKKASAKLEKVPIIATTAHAITGYRERCLEAGMDDYLSKPLRRKKLLAMVDKWIKRVEDRRLTIENFENENGDPNQTSAINGQSLVDNRQSKDDIPMDFERAIKEFEGDKEFLMEVLDGFLENVRVQTGTIRQAISDGDAETVWKEAHSIKGGAANLTADELSGVAFELENIGKSGVLEESGKVLERLEKEISRLKVYAGHK